MSGERERAESIATQILGGDTEEAAFVRSLGAEVERLRARGVPPVAAVRADQQEPIEWTPHFTPTFRCEARHNSFSDTRWRELAADPDLKCLVPGCDEDVESVEMFLFDFASLLAATPSGADQQEPDAAYWLDTVEHEDGRVEAIYSAAAPSTPGAPEAPVEASAGDIALYLLSSITKLYRQFEGQDNELTRSAIEAAERLLADEATSSSGAGQ